jgi:hypothetical protein
MKIKDNKCKCGNDDFFFADKGNQTGIYCSYCGKWLKWADKDEQNLRMKQTSVLDKIITDIENIEIEGYIRDVECFNAGINTTLNIINKYR